MELKARSFPRGLRLEIGEDSVEPVSELGFGAQSGEVWVLRVSVEALLEVDFGAQSGEL